MASRVNIRFALLLSASLGAVFFVVAGVAAFIHLTSGGRHVRAGDAAFAKGEYAAAENSYSRAVAKEQSNLEWIEKWREAMIRKIPESETEYRDDYRMYAGGILPKIATLHSTNVAATRAYLDERFRQLRYTGFSRDAWEGLAKDASDYLARFETAGASADPSWATLRRYRGLALVEIMKATDAVDQAQVALAKSDLEAALAADARDGVSAGALMEWNVVHEQRAIRDQRAADAAPFRAEARAVIDRFLAANPEDPMGLVRRLALRLEDAQRGIDPRLPDEERMPLLRASAAAHEDELLDLAARCKSAAGVDFQVLNRLALLAQVVVPDRAHEVTLEVLDAQAVARPDDADLLALRADLLENQRRNAEAIETHARILSLPDRPVSLEGLMLYDRRVSSLYTQATLALNMGERTTDAAEKGSSLAKAKEFRDALARRLSARDATLLVVNARIAFVENDLLGAKKLLSEFNAVSASSSVRLQIEGLMLDGRVAMRLSEFGRAEERFQQVLQRRPTDLMAMAALAEVSVALNKRARAIQLLEIVSKSDPDNAAIAERLTQLKLAEGMVRSEDPVLQLIADSRRVLMGSSESLADPSRALAMLREGLAAHASDPRLVEMVANVLFSQERVGEAIVEAEKGLEANPGNERLAELLRFLRASNSLEDAIAMIDASQGTEVEKLIEKSRQYRKYNADTALVVDALRRAVELEPTNPTAVELLFVEALRAKDLAEAERLAAQAETHDLDRAKGIVFRARVLSARGQNAEAAALLQQAVDQGLANSRLLRLLASIQLDLGRTPAAIQSFRDALARQPDDTDTAIAFINALVKMEQYQEALDVARVAEPHARMNRGFINLWLDLEARSGNREFAVTVRERVHTQSAEDAENALALATLYTDMRRWSDARRILDPLRAAHDSLEAVALDARWHADQNDLARAQQVFVEYIVKLRGELGDESMGPEAYLAFGQFMVERRDPEVGLAAIEQGRRFQKPDTRIADLFRGDMLFRLARFDEAAVVYKELVEAKLAGDADLSLTKRLIEATIRAGRAGDADTIIRSLGEGAMADLGVILLAAEAANEMKDTRRSLDLLERAVASFPNDSVAYFRRARTISVDPERLSDAIADLNKAISLRPNFWQAIRARAEVHRAMGNADAWIADLRGTLEANPGLDDLRNELILDLVRRGREGDAVDVAKAAVQKRPSDLLMRTGIGETFAKAGLPARAVEYIEPVWTDVKDPGVAQRLVNAYLRLPTPALSKAEAVLTEPKVSVESFPGLLMARAHLRALQKRAPDVRADASRAFDLVVADPNSIMEWFRQVREVYPETKDALAFLESVDLSRGPETWTSFFRAEVMLGDESMRDQALALLGQAEAGARSPVLVVGIRRLMSVALYEAGRFEDAVSAMKKGLEVDPASAELNNNAAYVLAKDLNRPSEALPFALRAVELQPDTPGILDTLGYVQKQLGDVASAEETLTRALRMSSLPADTALVTIHLGQLMVLKNDARRALELAQQARQILRGSPELEERFSKELDELTAKIR